MIEREELDELFNEIVSHPWFIGGRQLDPKRIEMFHMACYNLDTFREFVFKSTFLTGGLVSSSLWTPLHQQEGHLGSRHRLAGLDHGDGRRARRPAFWPWTSKRLRDISAGAHNSSGSERM